MQHRLKRVDALTDHGLARRAVSCPEFQYCSVQRIGSVHEHARVMAGGSIASSISRRLDQPLAVRPTAMLVLVLLLLLLQPPHLPAHPAQVLLIETQHRSQLTA